MKYSLQALLFWIAVLAVASWQFAPGSGRLPRQISFLVACCAGGLAIGAVLWRLTELLLGDRGSEGEDP
jgi:hypothetical protein